MATTSFRLTDIPLYLQRTSGSATPILYSAKNFRMYTAAYHRRSGPLGPLHFRVTQSPTVGWSVRVKAGFAHVSQFYTCYLSADTDLSVPSTWKPTSGSVNHQIYLTVYDELIAGNDSYAALEAVQDQGSGASPPAGAASYIPLATVTMSATQSNIQDANIANRVRHGGSAYEKVDMDGAGYLRSDYQSAPGDGHTGAYLQYDTGTIRLSGRILRKSALFTSGSASQNLDLIVADLPPEYRPASTRSLVGSTSKNMSGGSSLYFYRLEAMSDGKLVARIPTGQAVEYVTFDNMSYTLDNT